MSISFALVDSTPYRLRYLATNGGSPLGGSGTIPNDGGATPDLLTDLSTAPSGPMRRLVRARLDGIGIIAAGALNQAQARAVFMSDNPTTQIGNINVARGVTTVVARTGSATWGVDANVDGQGDPVIAVLSSAAAGDAYVDITCRHTYNL